MFKHIPYILVFLYLLTGTAHAAFTGHGSGTGTYAPLTATVDVDNMTATTSTTGIDARALLLDNAGTNNKWTLAYTWLWIKGKADTTYAALLSDPGASKVRVWDDADNAEVFATLGTGLSYDSDTNTISAPRTLGSTDIDTSAEIATIVTNETGSGALVFATSPTLVTPILGTPTSGTLTNCTFPTLNQDTTGSAGSLLSTGSTGKMTIVGPGTGTTRSKTIRDANDTILELGGSYTPTGTWDYSTATLTLGTPSFTAMNLPTSNADPSTTAGQIRHDSTVAGITGGALKYYNGTAAKTLADYDSTTLTDGYYLKYSAVDGGLVLSEGLSVASFVDLTDVDETSREEGDVFYVDSSLNLVNLHHGTNTTQFLRTGGHGAIPSWATPASAGDMSAASYPDLVAIEALAKTDNNVIVGNGSAWVAESGATARTSLGAAASGANSDITSLTGLTTALATTMGGTGVKNNAASTITITGAYGLTLTLTDTTAITFPTSGTLATTAQIPTASSLHLDDVLAAVGLTSGYTSMGVTFTGSTITDDTSTVVSALQELETAVEAASTPTLDVVGDMAADGSIGMTGYKLTLTSTLNAAGANLTMTNTTADLTADVSFIDLFYTDDGDANGFFMRGYDNNDGDPAGGDLKWSIGKDGDISTTGTITSTAATSSIAMSADASTITHTGATSLTVASNTGGLALNAGGTVTITANGENLIFTGGSNSLSLSSSSSMATLDTGSIGLILDDAFLEVPNSDDPDVAVTGRISWDTDGWLRMYDGSAQVAVGRKQEEIHVTVIKPNDLADAQRDAFLVWSNESGMTFTVTGWKGWSDTDNTTLNIETTAADGQTNATVDAVELATNGTGVYTGADTTITAATIANGSLIWLDFDDTDTPGYVKMTIYGYYNADVN